MRFGVGKLKILFITIKSFVLCIADFVFGWISTSRKQLGKSIVYFKCDFGKIFRMSKNVTTVEKYIKNYISN